MKRGYVRRKKRSQPAKKSADAAWEPVLVVTLSLMPVVFFVVVGTTITRMNLTQWHHPLGLSLAYGFGIALLCLLFAGVVGGASTAMELGIHCLIYLLLFLFLLPVFSRARSLRHHHNAMSLPAAPKPLVDSLPCVSQLPRSC